MRILTTILIALLSLTSLQAQNIIQAEYYIDVDPGMGNATQISIDVSANPSTTLTLATDGLPIGLHAVGIRVKNENDEWGITAVISIRVQENLTEIPLVEGEYFWDEDPGIGMANTFLFGATQSLNEQIAFSTTGLTLGEHILCVRVKNQLGNWSHYITDVVEICEENPALAGFLFYKDNHTILCSDTSLYTDSVYYAIDKNGEQLALINQPNVNYEFQVPGLYSISQIAANACNQDTSSHEFFIKGIDRIFPTISGPKTLAFVDIYGGFDEVNSVYLELGGTQIAADSFHVLNAGQIRAIFWIYEFAPLGDYDVVVESTSGSDVLASAFTVEEIGYFNPSSYISGRTRFLTNTWTNIRIYIQNNGNSTEYAVPIYIGMPGYVEAKVLNPIIGGDSLPAYLTDRFALDEFFVVEDSLGETTSFMLLNKPFMRPGELSYIDVAMRTASTTEFRVVTAFGKGIYTAEEIYNFDEFNRTSCKFFNPCIQDLIDGLGFVPVLGCASSAFSLGCSIGDFVSSAAGGAGSGVGAAFINNGMESLGVLTCGVGATDEAVNFGLMVINWGLGAGSIGAGALDGGGGSGGGSGGPGGGGGGSIDPCASCFTSGACGGGWDIFQPAGSLDPNDKSGPLGPTVHSYINGYKEQIHYRINFENVDTATAPAREVFVYDTLDLTYLDIENFRFTAISFSDSSYTFDVVVTDTFIRDFDLRPLKNTILRVEGKIDADNGVVSICYKSLDPETMDLTLDVDAGFLNPNVNGTEGQGYFEFLVGTKDLEHLDVIENKAYIVFDNNASIVTNTWWNTVDTELPESNIANVRLLNWNDSTHMVVFDNIDQHSGFDYQDLWVAKDDGDYQLVGRNLRQDSVKIKLEPNASYIFLSLGADRVLNFEDVPDDPEQNPDYEYSTVVSGIKDQIANGNMVDIFPNPAQEKVSIHVQGHRLIDRVLLFGIDGRIQKEWTDVLNDEALYLEGLDKGVYFLEFRFGNQIETEKIVLN